MPGRVSLFLLVGLALTMVSLACRAPAREIDSFEDCARAGYPVLQTYPRQCQTPDSRTFTEPVATPRPITEEASLRVAREFLTGAPTFRFDGMPETLKLVEVQVLQCPYCWTYILEFQSRSAGYGDRTGQTVAQVITPHHARVVVLEGLVVSAVLDDQWDEMNQEALKRGGNQIQPGGYFKIRFPALDGQPSGNTS